MFYPHLGTQIFHCVGCKCRAPVSPKLLMEAHLANEEELLPWYKDQDVHMTPGRLGEGYHQLYGGGVGMQALDCICWEKSENR